MTAKVLLVIFVGIGISGCLGTDGGFQTIAQSSNDGTGGNNLPSPPSPPNLPPVPSPPVISGSYDVHPGCEQPPSAYLRDIYVDPVNGNDTSGNGSSTQPYKTLSSLITKKVIQAGDHLHLLAGNYGAITLSNFNSPALVNSTNWVWLDFKAGAKSGFVSISGVSRILMTGVEASGMTVNKFVVSAGGGSKQIIIADSLVYSGNNSNLNSSEWTNLSNGISISETYCGTLLRNTVRYVRHALAPGYSGLVYPQNSGMQLIQENDIQAISGDFMRMNASDLIIRKNKMIDGYVSAADGDGNHDDGIQGFKLDGGFFQNITIEENLMLDKSNLSRPYINNYQGFCIFDGLFKNLIFRKNVILAGAYHGISLYGVDGALVENNTVISTDSSTNNLWIGAFNSKGGVPPQNVVVRNNISTSISNTALMSSNVNNYQVKNPQSVFVQFDIANGLYDLNIKSTSALYGKGAGAY